jgi:hypothetical protein
MIASLPPCASRLRAERLYADRALGSLILILSFFIGAFLYLYYAIKMVGRKMPRQKRAYGYLEKLAK